MNGYQLRQALHSGKRVYGTLIVSPSPRWLQVLETLGLDFVFLDTEHIALDRWQLSWMCQAYAGLKLAPVVRIPRPDPFLACMALDGGAQGIIAPYVESTDEVRQLVGAVKYRPLKGERLKRVISGEETLENELREYFNHYNENNCLIVNIESVPALANLDAILSVEGLDAILIGPHDLSISLGIPEQYEHSDFIGTVDSIIERARTFHIGAGIHATFAGALEQEIRWAQRGANLIVHWADIITFRKYMQQDIENLKAALGDLSSQTHEEKLSI